MIDEMIIRELNKLKKIIGDIETREHTHPTFGGAVSFDGNIVFNESGLAANDFRVESDTEANMILLDSSANNIELGGTTNGVKIEKGGAMTLLGNGRVINTVNLGIDGLSQGATAPGVVKVVNYYGYAFKVNDDGFVRPFEIPYNWDTRTAIEFKIHWYCNNTSASKYIKWQVDYSSVQEDSENVNVATTTTDSGDVAVPTTAYKLNETTISIPAAGLAQDDVMGIQIKRIQSSGGPGAVPDNYPVVVSLEIEITCDRLGELM